MKKKRFVLLDRDGTVILERHYLSDPEEVKLFPNTASALKKLKDLGFGLIIITNQAAVGRGFFDLKQLELIHRRLKKLLKKEGIVLDGIYFCPHTPEDNCRCRKPKLGLVEMAIKDHNFDPNFSFVIGDKAIDIKMGKNLVATTFLVRTGYGSKVDEKQVKPDYVVSDLQEAAEKIQTLI